MDTLLQVVKLSPVTRIQKVYFCSGEGQLANAHGLRSSPPTVPAAKNVLASCVTRVELR